MRAVFSAPASIVTHAAMGHRAEAELHFDEADGPLAEMKLVGFGIWERADGVHIVTMPARSYNVNGEQRSFALLRSTAPLADSLFKAWMLTRYHEWRRGDFRVIEEAF